MRCEATVYKRDTYRYTGHGSSGFTMHYSKEQCTREALPDGTRCWQHDETRRRAALLKGWQTRRARRQARGER